MDGMADSKVGKLIVATRDTTLIDQLRAMEPRACFALEVLSDAKDLLRRFSGIGWAEPPAVILLDGDLDDRKGSELMRELRGVRSDLKVIFLTSRPTSELEVEMRRQGAYMFLAKPASPEYLMRIVEKAVEHTSRLIRLRPTLRRARHG